MANSVSSNSAPALPKFWKLPSRRKLLVLSPERSMLRRGLIFRAKLRRKRRRSFRSCSKKRRSFNCKNAKRGRLRGILDCHLLRTLPLMLKRRNRITVMWKQMDFGGVNLAKTLLLKLAFCLTGVLRILFSEREAEEQAERERLRKQWLREQEQIRNEPLEITYSYWDGTGHRRVVQVRKGDSIGEFLRAVQQQLAPEFREIRTTSVENLVYVKEDLIIPHQHSFYDLIVNKARGKSGPLFHFDVHEDVRTTADATIEKDESHAGKVVERHWYEENKHIFPASRWEIYDPARKWERYTIHGD
ncbi:protein XAP5 CIRCADIAN TIMEKEEPER isoform X2 [Lotus japonicus]|uniref:protein XAP5 CIRCADIAN TIMEKEEPER isoform X2 n=1 Tax=Lotus japonicus TaxID=34305 RepID=UPI00258F8185|nr:protein XAP5 CIRCADIAN TIMEKEEPER isoform X2 [Lotus japonicus]